MALQTGSNDEIDYKKETYLNNFCIVFYAYMTQYFWEKTMLKIITPQLTSLQIWIWI